MKKILFYLRPYSVRVAIGLVIKISGSICELLIPIVMGYLIDEIVPMKQVALIFLWGIVMLMLAVGALTGNITANRMASRVSRNATEQIRLDLYRKITYLSSGQSDELTAASLISRLTSDTYNIHQTLGMIQRLGVRAPIMILGGMCMTFLLDVPLTLALLAATPLVAVALYSISVKGGRLYRKVQESNDRFVRLMREDIAGIRVIKALSKMSVEKEKFNAINEEVVERDQKAGLIMNALNPVVSLLLNLDMVCIIAVGAWRVNAGLLTPGTIIAFMTYVTMISNTFIGTTRLFMGISKANASAGRIAEVLEMPEDLQRADCEKGFQKEYITFEHVDFEYGNGRQILHDVCFSVPKGGKFGIIGPTGSGKSTVVQLLMRFYDASKGHIYVDGRDVRSYHKKELRSKFGAVFQNDTIFQDSLYENINLGRDISKERVSVAAAHAQAETLMLQKGLDFPVAVRGANLSGGQKQRVLIARALAGRPEILILDDSSSALDYQTDAALRKTITEQYEDSTIIIVAQRISSVMFCDKILVLEHGQVIGYGSHEELAQSCQMYQEIMNSQMGEAASKGGKEVKDESVS